MPTIFIFVQLDTTDMVGDRKIRLNGIQEIPISRIANPFVKKSILVENVDSLQHCMEEAYFTATSGRPGPVVLEIPANIQRGSFEPSIQQDNMKCTIDDCSESISTIKSLLRKA